MPHTISPAALDYGKSYLLVYDRNAVLETDLEEILAQAKTQGITLIPVRAYGDPRAAVCLAGPTPAVTEAPR